MRRTSPSGPCQLCGTIGWLSFEHVPPESAGNDQPAREIDPAVALQDPTLRRGRTKQKGIGAYTLGDQRGCKCNNKTGAWYGNALAELKAQVEAHLRSGMVVVPPYELYPLRVVKQIVSMFFSIDATLRVRAPELAAFVLDREASGLPKPFRVFVYVTISTTARQGWITRQGTAEWSVAEITLRPLGYVLTAGEEAPAPGMLEITNFGDRTYSAREHIAMRLSLLRNTDLAAPGDYRTIAQHSATPNAFQRVPGTKSTFVVAQDL